MFAIWAVDVIENNSWTIISILHNLFQTVNMEYVSASKLHTWLLPKRWAVANRTELIFVNGWFHWSWHLGYAFRLKTWHALCFTNGTKTRVATWKDFITGFLHDVEAIPFTAYITECWFHRGWWLSELFSAESTAFVVFCSAKLSKMIWLLVTLCTEVILTFIASNSMISHMLGSFLAYEISLVILESFLNCTWKKLHDVSTGATNEIWIEFDNLHLLLLGNFVLFIWSKIFIEFEVLNDCLASRTFDIFVLRLS